MINGNNIIEKIRKMSVSELYGFANDIRNEILKTVSQNGGHLASNLGMVEATIVLHRLFDSPEDKIIFDVSHQCYAHKIITGRTEAFSSIRQLDGISGFTNKEENEHDILTEGHSGTSISSALGIAQANKLLGKDNYTIAVVGDGSMTNGMIYEALNNCADKHIRLIILVNDNEMSISRNVGGLHKYLSTIRTSKRYFSFKRNFENFLLHFPFGKSLAKGSKYIKDFFKGWFVKNNLFEDMGLIYLGAVDGNSIEKLSVVLEEAKTKERPTVVHMTTKKGLGYKDAEEHTENYHSVSPFNLDDGVKISSEKSFSSFMGDLLCEKAKKDKRICAITAAMCEGTGLSGFSREFPDNFFDVGIAEEHAITFAGGLSLNGMKPVVLLYSTFAQRVFDQMFHDISIQNLPLVLALDRSGIVAGDGVTHQGIFDYSLFSSLKNTYIYSPESYRDIEKSLVEALDSNRISIIRYPKGKEDIEYESELQFVYGESDYYSYTKDIEKNDIVIISYGRMCRQGYIAYQKLCDKYSVGLIRLRLVYPLDILCLDKLCFGAKLVYIIDEGIKSGGVAEKLTALLYSSGYKGNIVSRAIEDYIPHGDLNSLIDRYGFTGKQIAENIDKEFGFQE